MKNIKHKLLVAAVPLLLLGLSGCGANNSTNSSSSLSSATSSQGSQTSSTSTSNNESNSSSENNTDNGSDSLSSLKSEQVAAAVLAVGAQSNETWSNLKDSATSGDGNLQVDLDSDTMPNNVTQSGKGMFYSFSLDGNNYGLVNGYTISQDGKSIYLYTEQDHDSADRTIAPFKTISTSQVVKAVKHGTVNDIANNTTIESN